MPPPRGGRAAALGVLASLLLPATALAQEETTLDSLSQGVGALTDELNTTWIMVATALVFFMQAGFAFLEIGFSRGKNAGMGIAKILVNFSIASIMWWVIGFAIAFGGGGWLAGDTGFLFQFGRDLSG